MALWDEADNDIMGPLIGVLGSDADFEDVKALAETFKTWKTTQRTELWDEFVEWFAPDRAAGALDFTTNPQAYLVGMQKLLTKDLGFLQEGWIRRGLLAIAEEPLLKFQWDRYLKQEKLSPAEFWGVLQQMETHGRNTRDESAQKGLLCEVSQDLVVAPNDANQWLIDELLPVGGFSILGAKPKVGKSTFAFSLGWAIVRGEHFLGKATKQGRVLHLALEGVRQQDTLTLQQMGTHLDHLIRFGQQLPGQVYDALETTIRRENLSLVILDTVFRFCPVADMNDYAQVNNAFARLIELGQATDCHIMAVHHLRKQGGDDVGDQVLGSTAIYGSVDTYIDYRLTGDDPESARSVFTRQRYGVPLPKTAIALDQLSGRIYSQGATSDAKRSERKQAIYDAMPPSGTPVSKSAVAEKVEGRRSEIFSTINLMIEDGELGHEKIGRADMVWVIEP